MAVVTDRQRTSATTNSTFLHLASLISCSDPGNDFRAEQKSFEIRPVVKILSPTCRHFESSALTPDRCCGMFSSH